MITNLKTVGTFLEDHARRRTLTTYQGILRHYGLRQIDGTHRWQDSALCALFGQIDQQDIAARRPLRTSSVVQKNKQPSPFPSGGYFTILCEYRRLPWPTTRDEKRRLHGAELTDLRVYYGRGLPPTGNFRSSGCEVVEVHTTLGLNRSACRR